MHTTAAALRCDTPVALPAALAIPLAELFPSPLNPRKTFNTDRLDELAASVAELGVIEPLIVRANQGMYEIIAGERRYRAAKQAGLSVVPCLVREMTDAQVLEHALAENRQRADVHPLEEAEAIQQLQALDPAYTVSAVAKRLGMSTAWVYGRLKLLQLSPLVQSAYRADAITAEHADLLTKLSQDQQEDALELQVFNRLLYAGLDQAEKDRLKIWSLGDAIQAERWDLVAPTLNPPAKLRAWIGRATVVDVSAQDVQQQFPDIAEALEAAEAEEAESILAVSELRDLTNAEAKALRVVPMGKWIEVVTDPREDVPLRSNQSAARCEAMRQAVVTHPGDRPPRVLKVCVKPSCPVHRPRVVTAAGTPSRAAQDDDRRAMEEKYRRDREAAEARQREFQEHRDDYRAFLVKQTAKLKLTAKVVEALIAELYSALSVKDVAQTFGVKLTDATAAQVLLLALMETEELSVVEGNQFAQRVGLDYHAWTKSLKKPTAKKVAKKAGKAKVATKANGRTRQKAVN